MDKTTKIDFATFAGGCFWCTEAVFKRLKGVESVLSGYSGGNSSSGGNPSYDQVSSGATGHAESIQIMFDPAVISYDKLLDIFFAFHDPTTKDRQGADIGTQYRSVIFYHTPGQKQTALNKIHDLEETKKYKNSVVTEVIPYSAFYQAEDYHQNYYDINKQYPYCRVVIDPKIRKLLQEYSTAVKEEYRS